MRSPPPARATALTTLGQQRIDVSGSEARLDDGTLSGLIRRDELGKLSPGTPADIVVLDDSHRVVRTVVSATEVFAR